MNDLISRQVAIEYFMTNTNWHDEDGYEIHDAEDKRALLKSYFDGIPSAQPDITDAQAIEHLQATGWMQNHDHEMYMMGRRDAIGDDSGSYDALIPTEQRWIPVSERLPEDGEKRYWICTDTGYQCQCRWTNINHFWTELTTDWHWHIMDIPQYSRVVAWRELPEPYKEEEQDADGA